MKITVAHSPDSDDAFMFYGLASGAVHVEGIEVEQVLSDIETLNRHFLTHPSNSVLATMTLFTAGKSPAESCAEILQKIQS